MKKPIVITSYRDAIKQFDRELTKLRRALRVAQFLIALLAAAMLARWLI